MGPEIAVEYELCDGPKVRGAQTSIFTPFGTLNGVDKNGMRKYLQICFQLYCLPIGHIV